MTEPIEKPVRETARGRDQATPVRAISGVTMALAILVGLVLAIAVIAYFLT